MEIKTEPGALYLVKYRETWPDKERTEFEAEQQVVARDATTAIEAVKKHSLEAVHETPRGKKWKVQKFDLLECHHLKSVDLVVL